jgi:hypothetical protein
MYYILSFIDGFIVYFIITYALKSKFNIWIIIIIILLCCILIIVINLLILEIFCMKG